MVLRDDGGLEWGEREKLILPFGNGTEQINKSLLILLSKNLKI